MFDTILYAIVKHVVKTVQQQVFLGLLLENSIDIFADTKIKMNALLCHMT
jgi:hypothetical protein